VESGNQKYAAGQFTEAERHYRNALRDLPNDPVVHFNLGAALYQQGEGAKEGKDRDQLLDAAEKEFRLATDASDVHVKAAAHYDLGNTLYARRRIPEAIEEFKRALRLDPTLEEARRNLEIARGQRSTIQTAAKPPDGGKVAVAAEGPGAVCTQG